MDVELLRTLYGGPPSEFVTSRDALVRELRAAGARDDAAAVKKLRRHTPTDWVLNRVAADRPDVVVAFADAAGQLRTAQAAAIEGRAGGDVRTAMAQLRERSAAVVAAATALDRGVPTADVTARLMELAGDERGTEQLVAGVLGSAPLDGPDPFAGLEPAPSTPRRAATESAKDTAKRPAKDTAKRAAQDAAKRRALVREATAALRTATAAESAASARVDAAERELAAARRELDAATSARAEAARRLDDLGDLDA